MKKHFKGAGRPVLVTCKSEYATGTRVSEYYSYNRDSFMILIPLCQGFGACTYFDDEPKMSHSVFCLEYDGCHCKYQYEDFLQATDAILLEHLESSLVDEDFKKRARELIKECPLEEEAL